MLPPLLLIILLVSAGGTIDVFIPPDTTRTQFNDNLEGTKQFLSWARTRNPKGIDTKICVVEVAERKGPTSMHSYFIKERQAAADALGTSYSLSFWSYETMQQAAKLYGTTIDQLAQRVCRE